MPPSSEGLGSQLGGQGFQRGRKLPHVVPIPLQQSPFSTLAYMSQGYSPGRKSVTFLSCCSELAVPPYPVGTFMVLCPSSRKPSSITFSSASPPQKPVKRPPEQF